MLSTAHSTFRKVSQYFQEGQIKKLSDKLLGKLSKPFHRQGQRGCYPYHDVQIQEIASVATGFSTSYLYHNWVATKLESQVLYCTAVSARTTPLLLMYKIKTDFFFPSCHSPQKIQFFLQACTST